MAGDVARYSLNKGDNTFPPLLPFSCANSMYGTNMPPIRNRIQGRASLIRFALYLFPFFGSLGSVKHPYVRFGVNHGL